MENSHLNYQAVAIWQLKTVEDRNIRDDYQDAIRAITWDNGEPPLINLSCFVRTAFAQVEPAPPSDMCAQARQAIAICEQAWIAGETGHWLDGETIRPTPDLLAWRQLDPASDEGRAQAKVADCLLGLRGLDIGDLIEVEGEFWVLCPIGFESVEVVSDQRAIV